MVKLVLEPVLITPDILRQLSIPAPQVELGISPVSEVPITFPPLSTKRTRMFGLIASNPEV